MRLWEPETLSIFAFGILLLLVSSSTVEPLTIGFSGNSIIAAANGQAAYPVDGKLPFFFCQVVTPVGKTIRVVGSATHFLDSDFALWEYDEEWTKRNSLPTHVGAVFVAGDTWGYVEKVVPPRIRIFGSKSEALEYQLPNDLDVDDSVPLIWQDNEQVAILAMAKKGVWKTDHDGLITNVVPGGPFVIRRLNLRTGVSSKIAPGERPSLSPNGRTLAYLRSGSLYENDLESGVEREVYRSHIFGPRAASFLWASDDRILLNVRVGSELFGLKTECKILDVATTTVKKLWNDGTECKAIKTPSQ